MKFKFGAKKILILNSCVPLRTTISASILAAAGMLASAEKLEMRDVSIMI